jgi:mono/diheme cytochrome c family protein
MMKFILGLVLGIILVPAAVALYLMSGRAPAAAADAPMPFERMIARKALHTRIEKEMPGSPPIEANEATYLAGAHIYKDNCAMCHGLPNQTPPAIARAMFPHAPQLFVKVGVTDDPPGETFWKAQNGIRLSGMPGFARSLSNEQLWQVSLLLANADKLPASAKQALAPEPSAIGPQK